MAGYEVIVKRLEPMRVVALTESLAGVEEISDACARMYPGCTPRWHSTGSPSTGCPWPFTRTPVTTTGRCGSPRLYSSLPGVTIEGDGLTTSELAAVERAATTVVRGAPDQFADAYRALHEWIDRTGDRATSFERELCIDCDGPRDTWVIELQAVLEAEHSAA
jgi:hypothetical protein